MSHVLRLAAGLVALYACGCAPAPAPAPAPPEEPAAPPMSLMNTTVVATTCPDITKQNARAAEISIRRLVEPCAKVPGGAAHFTATMLPGGRIELGSPEGDPTEGTIPTCVVKNGLSHRIMLRKPCVFRVQLEERQVPAAPAAPAQAAP
ncbi:MAG: hypothetical protein IT372_16435 [Polyangiaceae bacterium]|nr:hypothetical protein [Polyangiaceae bacterium]